MPKKNFLLLCFLVSLLSATAQTPPLADSLPDASESTYYPASVQTVPTVNYQKTRPYTLKAGEYRVLFHNGYAESDIRNTFDALSFCEKGIPREVHLFYSDFPRGGNFDSLNRQRVATLLEFMPALKDSTIEWTFFRQTDCRSRESAMALFHGFEVILEVKDKRDLSVLEKEHSEFEDFVVEKVLSRNDWKNMLIVTDMTGSMDPYIAQLFLWLKLNTIDGLIKQFVFFNDGDTQLDESKEIGRTGGIYATASKVYDEVELVALQCISSGHGGDGPENDLEALLEGMGLCPACEQVILIADNKSEVRDFELLSRIKRPIRVILCGAEDDAPRSEYLDLARLTGGSVHLMEEDLLHLARINEGEQIEINGQTFRITKNRFVEVKKM